MDLYLAEADVLGSLAHTRMLHAVGLLGKEDLDAVQRGLKTIYREIAEGKFTIEEGVEDVHSQVEFLLTQRVGEGGYGGLKSVRRTCSGSRRIFSRAPVRPCAIFMPRNRADTPAGTCAGHHRPISAADRRVRLSAKERRAASAGNDGSPIRFQSLCRLPKCGPNFPTR